MRVRGGELGRGGGERGREGERKEAKVEGKGVLRGDGTRMQFPLMSVQIF